MAIQLYAVFKMLLLSFFRTQKHHTARKPLFFVHHKQTIMPKNTLFKAYDLWRKNLHIIPSPPTEDPPTSGGEERLGRQTEARHQKGPEAKCGEADSAADPHRSEHPARGRFRYTVPPLRKAGRRSDGMLPPQIFKPANFQIPRAAGLTDLQSMIADCATVQCDGAKCYNHFARENFPGDFVDIRGPGPLGYAAYTKPGVSLKKGQWLGEYLGDLRPFDDFNLESMYCFHIPNKCVLDAEKAGNWTRFINSSCRPNVQAVPEFVGKRSVLFFRAKKDIGPEEELMLNYGKAYFKKAGFPCACSVCEPAQRRQKGIAGLDPVEIRRIIDAL